MNKDIEDKIDEVDRVICLAAVAIKGFIDGTKVSGRKTPGYLEQVADGLADARTTLASVLKQLKGESADED